ncbi:MAG: Smr/MutS family protein [Deltaproteobacteria bacterium]|nr:Smr/MutS family protein [Deltaproteobacteria bacterium]
MTKFVAGQAVLLPGLNRKGTISAVLKDSKYRVSVGSFEMVCKEGELRELSRGKDEVRKKPFKKLKGRTSATLDLHGFKVNEGREALLQFISKAIMAGHTQLTIVHGHGTGALRDMVHEALASLDVVASFRHPMNNTASTKVYLHGGRV